MSYFIEYSCCHITLYSGLLIVCSKRIVNIKCRGSAKMQISSNISYLPLSDILRLFHYSTNQSANNKLMILLFILYLFILEFKSNIFSFCDIRILLIEQKLKITWLETCSIKHTRDQYFFLIKGMINHLV